MNYNAAAIAVTTFENKSIFLLLIKWINGKEQHNEIFKSIKWKAKISLEEGLSQTFDWYIKNKIFFKSVSKKIYSGRLGLKIW